MKEIIHYNLKSDENCQSQYSGYFGTKIPY